MNVPNILTFSRFALIPIYIFVSTYNMKIAFLILALAGITDVLDGHIARTRGLVTRTGAMLDPLADKLMMIVVVLSLLFHKLIFWEAAAAIFVRDIGMILGSAFSHFRGKRTVPANLMGKLTTILYYAAIMFIVFQSDLHPLFGNFAVGFLWFVIMFSFATSVIYIVQFRLLNQKQSNVLE